MGDTSIGKQRGFNPAGVDMDWAANQNDLSQQARSLWAKSDYGAGEEWLPLAVHMHDSFDVIKKLWQTWMPSGVKTMLARECGISEECLGELVGFLGAVHDIGKATPVFQISSRGRFDSEEGDLSWKAERAGLDILPCLISERGVRHTAAGEVILEDYLRHSCGWSRDQSRALASIVGSHHGKPPVLGKIARAQKLSPAFGWDAPHEDSWRAVQEELIEYAQRLSGFDPSEKAVRDADSMPVNVESAISGLVIMADWIASNQSCYPLLPVIPSGREPSEEGGISEWYERRARSAWNDIDIHSCWNAASVNRDTYSFVDRFGLPKSASPRPVQEAAMQIALGVDRPGLMIIEAPMGEGKTEAALAVAEILGYRCSRGGVCVALPTMATTDAMFSRVHTWIERLPHEGDDPESMFLAHGKAGLNEEYQGLIRASRQARYGAIDQDDLLDRGRPHSSVSASPVAEVSDWLQGRKKGMLANFVVCTVDQVLMGALNMKHLSLRHLALVNKVVIIDECHAYDMYMQQYLNRALEWLGSWDAPVILLSATLPANQRDQFVASYLRGRNALDGDSGLDASEHDAEKISYIKLTRRRRMGMAASSAGSEKGCAVSTRVEGYPLITYTSGSKRLSRGIELSSRSVKVELSIMPDDEGQLVQMLKCLLAEGGCAGVVCDTVKRAQRAFAALSGAFGTDEVLLTHSRFTDIDRMENEQRLRKLLGPQADVHNGERPERLIVVGTQVIEQSLDVDFDVLVSDVAPIDLLLQRVGRLHRHRRGEEEGDRPSSVREARCFVRGILSVDNDEVQFDRGIESVYERAALMETLAVAGLMDIDDVVCLNLPADIERLVQNAYGSDAASFMPQGWAERYAEAVDRRSLHWEEKKHRANACLLKSIDDLAKNHKSLVGLFEDGVDTGRNAMRGHDDDRGPRAVRDTQETVEVLLACERDDGLHLLPWIGDEKHGVEKGAWIPTRFEPDDQVAKVLSRCAVRLPLEMSPGGDIDELLDALEEMSGPYVGAWQDSRWLSGSLIIPLRECTEQMFQAEVLGWEVGYSRRGGLSAVHG